MLLLDLAVLLLSVTMGGPTIPVVAFWLAAGNCYALCLLAGSLLQQPRVRHRQPRQRLGPAPTLTFEAFGGPCDGKSIALRATEHPPDSVLVRNPGIHWMHRSRYDRVTSGSGELLSAGDVVEGQAVRLVRRYHYHGVADRRR